MSKTPADSIKLAVTSSPPNKAMNETRLTAQAAEFFGHDRATHNGFMHGFEPDESISDPKLRSVAIFFDETPYTD